MDIHGYHIHSGHRVIVIKRLGNRKILVDIPADGINDLITGITLTLDDVHWTSETE